MTKALSTLKFLVIVVASLFLVACTAQLVVSPDPALVEKLDALNTKTLTLFSALDSHGSRSNFSSHSSEYAQLIGGFEALKLRAEARPIPGLGRKIVASDLFRSICGDETSFDACLNSSPAALAEIVGVLEMMRTTHESQGLPSDILALFKGRYLTAVQQALAVETALAR